MLEWLKTPAVVALVSAVPAVVTFVLGYVRSSKSDHYAATTGAWKALVENLQAENAELRKQLEERGGPAMRL